MQQEKTEQFSFASLNNNLNLLLRLLGAINLLRLASSASFSTGHWHRQWRRVLRASCATHGCSLRGSITFLGSMCQRFNCCRIRPPSRLRRAGVRAAATMIPHTNTCALRSAGTLPVTQEAATAGSAGENRARSDLVSERCEVCTCAREDSSRKQRCDHDRCCSVTSDIPTVLDRIHSG